MQKFKIAVSKDQKKYTLVLDAQNESVARDKVHKWGYSILSVSTISDWDITGQKYYFEATLNGEQKKWKVVGEDIFKIYVKLRKDLGYKIITNFDYSLVHSTMSGKVDELNSPETVATLAALWDAS